MDDRLVAATTLITKFRSYPRNAPLGVEQKAVPAAVTKLIMATLIEADWEKHANDQMVNPMNAVSQLGVYPGSNGIPAFKPTPNDPNPGATYRTWYKAEIKKWYEANGEKFEIKENVAKEKK